MSGVEARGEGVTFWRYRRPFRIQDVDALVTLRSRSDGLHSELAIDGKVVARDRTPVGGPEAVRNHSLSGPLADGRTLEVEAGYISIWNTAIAARVDGVLVHESHPGRTIAYPERYRGATISMGGNTLGEAVAGGMKDQQAKAAADGYDLGVWSRNRWALGVDIGLGILFFVVAKLTDLSTAALVGAGAGIFILVLQRFVKVDLIGGLALFGVVMLLISAALAIAFQDDMAVKQRSTVVGLISATLFLGDGLIGGNRLGRGLTRYLPYTDLDPARLALGMGVLGLVMAGLNSLVAIYASTDVWLFYSTFVDFVLVMMMVLLVFRFARGRMFPRGYRDPRSG